MAEDEVKKLNKRLTLLREEHVKLQSKYNDLERKYEIAQASLSSESGNGFVTKILSFIAHLLNNQSYSDVTLSVEGRTIPAHKFVLEARSRKFIEEVSHNDLLTSTIEISSAPYDVVMESLKWVYSDSFDGKSLSSDFLLDMLKFTALYDLKPLMNRIESCLSSLMTTQNCISLYEAAYAVNAQQLMNHSSELISTHWEDFSSEDFKHMTAQLLYEMLKSKSRYPLHRAIKAERDDVVFLYIVEFDKQLSLKLNERDENGMLPLELALNLSLEGIAETLVKNGVDISKCNHNGETLLHQAVDKGDEFSAVFLIENGINLDQQTYEGKETALHKLCAGRNFEDVSRSNITSKLESNDANVNLRDSSGCTPLHRCIQQICKPVFDILVCSPRTDIDLMTFDHLSPLALSLNSTADQEYYMAGQLLEKGCKVNTKHPDTGNTILHELALQGNEKACLYIVSKISDFNHTNIKGETVLHIAAEKGLVVLVEKLLLAGVNPNIQTKYIPTVAVPTNPKPVANNGISKKERKHKAKPLVKPVMKVKQRTESEEYNPFLDDEAEEIEEIEEQEETTSEEESENDMDKELLEPEVEDVTERVNSSQSALHLAIEHYHREVIEKFIEHKNKLIRSTTDNHLIMPNFTLKDALDQTPLAVALWSGLHDIARLLMLAGCNINDTNREGFSLLHQAIIKKDTPSCIFLLENGADISKRTVRNESPMEMAIQRHLAGVVSALCSHRAPVNGVNSKGNPLLWQALELEDYNICDILVKNKCDLNSWHNGPGNCLQTLLHRAIDENKQKHACYLIQKGCDVNSSRRPSLEGETSEEGSDGQTPLHLASSWGLEEIVQKLIECNADINAQDSVGRSALHISISNQQTTITSLLMSHPEINVLIRDSSGWTPFATAMTRKDNKAAQAILDRAPTAADQFDNRGRNFLHVAIEKGDIESVLFLISVQADVNSRMRNSSQYTPLHLATLTGSEIILRNLLLAGAQINELTTEKQSCLHLAASKDLAPVASILIDNGIDYTLLDNDRNNALHVAVINGSHHVVRVLLTETHIDAEAVNLKGQNPLHALAKYGKENSAAIFDLFLEAMPDYPINKPDMDGNTVLLLAYMNGTGNLCRANVRAGACLGQTNKQAVNIFNAPVASRNLLLKLLDVLEAEPPWADGDVCLECATKFNITTRKHHCRHCGRLLCGKCSNKEIPIVKYSLNKPVRVCDLCFNVLTLGAT